ncbi:calmodulin-interacting protein 111-like [Diospyros lotus]|uniref:calmodulin-interacting protein 111-like n=1 Tax=Diospyros lotus TaxID=55363 RepID=UPI002254CB52|nr:calmodulin-interacting protein 111-like [Diospyros lotus]XP_052189573.1 calmodulin-interacting protein 111-like [Diospyros lotus]XP_052189574.1 calmodulin-interacting protein 111-like [Diospyros lotus]XP_052189575.1 calmodulin-interacting protein 111-like [Diospyros lotus]XP_052189576.1 calmodulin-interacting protein 111-like [Diospyros lotus]XP_052189578.1 calmodulin-interacting protein 111-like [Diospyros lotus]XP_052189579.1 calmodulin-interacting protein 111-like [Diospyros lotus]
MPAKSKKHSKAALKLSYADQSASPQSSSSSTPLPGPEVSEEDILGSIDEATNKYPCFIGKSSFMGRVTDVEADAKGCKIWISEASMVSSSLSPGSTVSVSLPSPKKKSSNTSPLCSIADEYEKQFGIACSNKMATFVGNYFALATVYPSCKVLKNGVRLSSNLSSSLGCPTSGRIIFVSLIQSQSAVGVNGNSKLHSPSSLSSSDCKELYLELVYSKNDFTKNSDIFCGTNFTGKRANGQFENGKISSPVTPSYSKSKLSSLATGQFSSTRYEESISSSPKPNVSSFNSPDVAEVLGDESAKLLLESCATSWLCSRTLLLGNFVTVPILSKFCTFQVVDASGISVDCSQDATEKFNSEFFSHPSDLMKNVNDAFLINHKTKVLLSSPLNSALEIPQEKGLPCLELEYVDTEADQVNEKLGGLSKEYALLKDIIICLSLKDTLSSLGLRPTKGVLLHGPPGTGKTALIQNIARDTGVNLFTVNGSEIISQYYGESEQALVEVFNSARRATLGVVFIDELDAIAPARRDGGEELSQRMVATLLNLMDGICRTDNLLVIAATNRPDSIEPALRRPGRLDREIEIGVPSPKQRYDILLAHLSRMEHSLSDMQVQHLATATHGFVGADIAALCNEAAMICLRRCVYFLKSGDASDNRNSVVFESCCTAREYGSCCANDTLDSASSSITYQSISSKIENAVDVREIEASTVEALSLEVTFEDFEKAKMKVRPSAMREVMLEFPMVNWKDVGGQEEVKAQLMEAVEWPQKHQDAFKRIGTRPPTGVLMFGPPGCSKTLLARAVASEAGLNFLAVKGPELFSKWVGESEKAVRSLFAKARANAPSIIFFDEIDGLAVIRGKEGDGVSVADRVMGQLLVELDGLQQRANVTVIAATNRPDKIDPALLRPGRFDRLLYVGPPSEIDREDIFRIHLRKMPCSPDVCIRELALLTEGCTGADISLICREAGLAAMEESLDASAIRMIHLRTAIKQVQPSEVQSYQDLSIKFERLVYSSTKRDSEGVQPCSGRSIWKSFWMPVISTVLVFSGFLAALSQRKSPSYG